MGRWVRIVSAVGLLVGVIVLGAPAGAQNQGTCTQPYPPVFTGSGYYQDQGHPDVGPQVEGITMFGTPVLDAEYTAQITEPNGTQIVVERPTGELRLTNGGAEMGATSAGDLDGDGFSEIWVNDAAGTTSWVVPYTTPAGTADVATVGIVAPTGTAYGSFSEGRAMDLYVGDSTGTVVYDGAQVLAAGAGGDASGLTPSAEHPGQAPLSLLVFSAGEQLILVPITQPTSTITSSGGATTTFATPAAVFMQTGAVSVLGREGARGRFLQLINSDRGGGVKYLWSYDDPCTPLEVASAPTTTAAAPAAAPLSLTG